MARGGAPKPAPRPAPKASRGAKPARSAKPARTAKAPNRAAPKKAAVPKGQRPQPRPQKFTGKDAARLQFERTWWAANQDAKDRLSQHQGHAVKSEAVGTILNGDRRLRWRTSHAIGAIFFLIVGVFTTAMAVASQNLAVAVLAFLFIASSLAFVTTEFAARRFPDPIPRSAAINQSRVEELLFVDDAPTPRREEEPNATLTDLFPPGVKPVERPTGAAAGTTAVLQRPEAKAGLEPETDTKVVEGPDEAKVTDGVEEPDATAGTTERAEGVVPAQKGADAVKDSETEAKAAVIPTQPKDSESRPKLPRNLARLIAEKGSDIGEVTGTSVTLVVSDLERSVDFYSRCLGLTVSDKTEEAAVVEAGFGTILLWHHPDAPDDAIGVMHLTFEVPDVREAFDSMRQKGVEFRHEPRTALLGEHYELRAAGFSDPDGHGLAITEHRRKEE
ncbi:VOC family protein [Salininema proteolyticum]|uniref:VOC family protein n=1 Tax=Salininema proteolyticum TaxID=1607685 RepID=A0ABV8U061_9ACTN